jgi:hypothetical protein
MIVRISGATSIFNHQLFNVQQTGIIQKIHAQFMAMSDDEDEDG